jgi:ribosomal protein S18 acetylase RimI-like enzyme
MAAASPRTLTPDDQARAVATLALAFAGDPVTRWAWPNALEYVSLFPDFARAFGGHAFAHGGAHATDGFAAVALWLPPDVHPDEEAMGSLMQRTLTETRLEEVSAIFEQMAAYHPSGPHWYLPLIGCDTAYQGQGHGSALMAYALAECDRQQLPAYLESTNPRNITLYLRHGFESLGTIQVGSAPPLIPMLRRPR